MLDALSQWACSPALFCSPILPVVLYILYFLASILGVLPMLLVLAKNNFWVHGFSAASLFLPMFMFFPLAALVLICSFLAQRAEREAKTLPTFISFVLRDITAPASGHTQLLILPPALWCVLGGLDTKAMRKI